MYQKIAEDTEYLFALEQLRNLIHPFGRGFFLTSLTPKHTENICYMFNPYLREEIHLAKEVNTDGHLRTEWINKYSQYSLDESYVNINGRNKDQLDVKVYDIVSDIDKNGVLTSKAALQIDVLSGPTQFIQFSLMPTLHIDSILDRQGNHLPHVRKDVKYAGISRKYESQKVGVLLPEPVMYQDSLLLTFYYNGEVAVSDLGQMYIYTGSEWYPKYGFRDRALFNMEFSCDKKYEFVASGIPVDKKIEGDKKVTSWKVIPEASNVSFNLGLFKKFRFEEADVIPVDVYFSKTLHAEIAQYLSRQMIATGAKMEEQVSTDVINAIRLFNHTMGGYPLTHISVTEVFSNHGEAFPGFLHLGFETWVDTDNWGSDRLFRSHEVAHQWWGVDVGYETYHDQWLSEGFATYSSLMYLQAAQGNDIFLDKLKEYRNDIYSARNYILGSGEESGPIALGYRTSSSQTEGDFNLIIYKKGAFILHMLRNMLIDLKTMNQDLFLQMLQEFYGKYRGKNATTLDFRRVAERYAGIDLSWFFDQWVYNNYLPESRFTYTCVQETKSKLFNVQGHISTENVPEDFKMFIPLEIKFEGEGKAYIRLFIDTTDFSFELPDLKVKPKKLILNPFESVLIKIKQ